MARKKKAKATPITGPLIQTQGLNLKSSEKLFSRIAEEALHGHRHMFDSLSDHEQKIVIQWLSDALVDGDMCNAVHDLLWEADFHTKPVDIETFITDPHYLGRVVSGLDDLDEEAVSEGRSAGLDPHWVDDLKIVFAPGSQIFEWVMTGGIGIGKTTVAMIAMCYKAYYLSCMRNPPAYYGLLHDSLFILGIYSITKRQVADTGYFKLRGWLDSSPYFRFDFPRSRKIDSQVVFQKKNLKIIPGSQELHALGLDMYSFAMDEVNFMYEKQDKERGVMIGQAYKLYNAVHTRMESRFIRPGGTIPGIMLLMSSRNAQTSFLEELIKKRGYGKHTYISDYALWETKPAHRYVLPKFRVEVGDRVAGSRILRDQRLDIIHEFREEKCTLNQAAARGKKADITGGEKSRLGSRVVEVPGEFLKVFEEDPDQALRDVAGVATFNVSPLIRDRQSILDAVREGIPNPWTRDEVTLDIQDDIRLEDHFQLKKVCRVVAGKWVPKLNPHAPRFMHIDLGLTGDAAGIALGHASGIVTNHRTNLDGTFSAIENPFILIDFMLRIIPPSGSEIEFAKIRAFVGYIKRMFPLKKVTLDGWQSIDFLQIISKPPLKLKAKVQSIDKKDIPYISLRSAHFERRIGMYDYRIYQDEILDLQRDAKKMKVDHPAKATRGGKGTKDVADCVAGVTFGIISDEDFWRGSPVMDEAMAAESKSRSARVVDPATMSGNGDRVIGGRKLNWEKLRDNMNS